LKPSLNINILNDSTAYQQYIKNHYVYLGVYLLLIILIQFIINVNVISNNCGGNLTDNIGSAGLVTIFPWFLIFGAIMMVVNIYPGFKSAFSDVIGYYYIYITANELITTLLIDQNVENKLNDDTITKEQKNAMRQAADTIIKICGNTSILINQMSPTNFLDYWKMITPLMKDEYKNLSSTNIVPPALPVPSAPPASLVLNQPNLLVPSAPPASLLQKGGSIISGNIQEKLFELIVTKDNVGEAMWFIYTGILLTSFVQLTIVSKGCQTNPATAEKNYQAYLQNEKATLNKNQQSTNAVYTVTT
jgi:hypothetical protein